MSDERTARSGISEQARTEIERYPRDEWYCPVFSVSLDGHTRVLVIYDEDDADSIREGNKLANRIADLLGGAA